MTRRAVIAPDERSWLMWGRDLRAEGFIAAASLASAEVLLAPARVPASLSCALREAWEAMPLARELVTPADPLGFGAHTRNLLLDEGDGAGADSEAGDEHAAQMHTGDGGHDMHDGDGDHDHDAMMAVTGDPSADGLVMEDLDLVVGPLSSMLPGGIVARLTVDGDVVCRAELSATLDAGEAAIPDPTAEAAWNAALGYAAERAQGRPSTSKSRKERLVAVELERAVSHGSWLADVGELLGWARLADAGRDAALAALNVTAPTGAGLDAAEAAAREVAALLDASRRLHFRLGGLAPLTLGDVDRFGLAGPNARAAGLAVDARSEDPFYVALGFTPTVAEAGDAAARVAVRAEELVASIALVRRGSGDAISVDATAPDAVEGPRGPVAVHTAPEGQSCTFVARGADAILGAAAERVEGLEWSAALAAMASFDLPGWRVGP